MNHMELQYFKTDKNGTKYFYDWKCPRCGGAGFADKWIHTGRVFVQELPDGSKVELPEPEPIHTYNGWKDLGYQVKKGEHAKASFPIWKWAGKKDEETGEESGRCWQRKAFWFTADQVEKIA